MKPVNRLISNATGVSAFMLFQFVLEKKLSGSINFGYGDPPKEPQRLQEIAEKYGLSADELIEPSESYETRPPFIIEIAKRRLASSARLTGTIVERKRAKEQVMAAFKEKEVLLRELYHRTKNNMQVIRGLLTFQSQGIEDDRIRDRCNFRKVCEAGVPG